MLKTLSKKSYEIYKNKSNLKYRIILIGSFFIILTLISSIYAANYGWFVLKGTVARTQNMDIRFADAKLIGLPRVGESVTISVVDDYKIINISVQLMMPGDSRAIEFKIQNIGNQAVRLKNIVSMSDSVQNTGLKVEFPDDITESANLKDYVLVSNETSDVFLIYVTWDANATNVQTGVFRDFFLNLEYQNAMVAVE